MKFVFLKAHKLSKLQFKTQLKKHLKKKKNKKFKKNKKNKKKKLKGRVFGEFTPNWEEILLKTK